MKSGDIIGKYRLISKLGRGGMGEVWVAKAAGYAGFTKTVVLKTLLPELASDPLFIELLAGEAKTCSKLSHPNLIEVFDFTCQDGIYLLAMEHVLGQPLNAVMRAATARNVRLPAWLTLRVAWECCVGVQYAHEQGVIHCDLSPSNVMITYTGATKVLDFGVAHATAQGPRSDRLKGKYSYMAPERIKTRAADVRTDIYSLGVTLYLAFTGQLPFVADSDAALFHKITHEKVVAPSALADVDPVIEQVILRAIHPEAGRRYQTLSEVLAALAPCLEGKLGTYGQQHVAAFLATLFGPQPAAQPGLPAVPPPPPRPATAATDHGGIADDVEEIEIDIDTAPHVAPHVAPPAVPSTVHEIATRPVRNPIAAAQPAPLPPPPVRRAAASDQIPALIDDDSPGRAGAEPLIAAFAQASTPLEPRTSVQSLFGDRPVAATTIAGLFGRARRESEPRPEPPPEPPPKPPREAWPWPVSRTKSE